MEKILHQKAEQVDSRVIYLSDKQLGARFGVHRTAIWRWVREGDFPAPVQLSKGCTRWRLANVEAWELAKSEQAAG